MNVLVEVVLWHPNDVRVAWGCVQILALRRDDKVFCLHELAALSVHVGIPPDLFERVADQG